MGIWIMEDFVAVEGEGDDEKRIGLGMGEAYETRFETLDTLFVALVDDYGPCTSNVWTGQESGPPRCVGWVFEQEGVKYEDSDETYTREVWVTVHEGPPTRTVEYHWADVPEKGEGIE